MKSKRTERKEQTKGKFLYFECWKCIEDFVFPWLQNNADDPMSNAIKLEIQNIKITIKYTWKFQKLYGGIVRVCFSPNDKWVKVVPSGGNDAWEFDDAETKKEHCLYFKWSIFD